MNFNIFFCFSAITFKKYSISEISKYVLNLKLSVLFFLAENKCVPHVPDEPASQATPALSDQPGHGVVPGPPSPVYTSAYPMYLMSSPASPPLLSLTSLAMVPLPQCTQVYTPCT